MTTFDPAQVQEKPPNRFRQTQGPDVIACKRATSLSTSCPRFVWATRRSPSPFWKEKRGGEAVKGQVRLGEAALPTPSNDRRTLSPGKRWRTLPSGMLGTCPRSRFPSCWAPSGRHETVFIGHRGAATTTHARMRRAKTRDVEVWGDV